MNYIICKETSETRIERSTYGLRIHAPFAIMIWKSLFSAVAILAHILPALAAPALDSELSSQSEDKYVFAHFMVSIST